MKILVSNNHYESLIEDVKQRLKESHDINDFYIDYLEWYSFPQLWSSTALGFGGIGGAAMTTAQTDVLIYFGQIALVYFAGRFAYEIPMNNLVKEAINKFQMPHVKDKKDLIK